MIKYKTGNILDDDADWIVNTVNCVGVMGAGLAKLFKEKFPIYWQDYQERYKSKKHEVGTPRWHHNWNCTIDQKTIERGIISFHTKNRWSNPSRIEYISVGLTKLLEQIESVNDFISLITTIAFPKLGCGLDGLDWEKQVKPLMEKFAEECELQDIEVIVYV